MRPVSLLSYCTYFPDFNHSSSLSISHLSLSRQGESRRSSSYSPLCSLHLLVEFLSSRLLAFSFVATYQAITVSLSSLFPSLPTSGLWHLTLIYRSGIGKSNAKDRWWVPC